MHLNAHVCIGCAYWFLKILLFKGLRFLGILFVRVKSEAGSAERWKRTERTVQMHYKYKIQKNMKYKYKTKTNFTIYSIFVWGGHLRKGVLLNFNFTRSYHYCSGHSNTSCRGHHKGSIALTIYNFLKVEQYFQH